MSDLDALAVYKKRRYWRIILLVAILIIVIALMLLVTFYLAGMAEVKAQMKGATELEREISELSARGQILQSAAKWTLPVAITGSLMINIARYKLRKIAMQCIIK